MRRVMNVACLLLISLALTGCLGSGSSENTASAPANTGKDYYYDEFADVAVPVDMSPSAKDTFITYSGNGMKLGIQLFSGRVEMGSLISVMQRYMARDGWTLRSVFRAQRSIQVFERSDRVCALYITEGMLYTEMLVFVSPKLADGAVLHTPTPAAPAPAYTPSAKPVSSGGVQAYPAGGFSNSASTSLSQ